MTDAKAPNPDVSFGDALTAPFWEAAYQHRLMVQQCKACGRFQFYPRPFCLSCGTEKLDWVIASGLARVVSKTTVRIEVTPEWQPPYAVAVVQLEEGPTLLTNLVNGDCAIGSRVKVTWRDRLDAPPFPAFELARD